VEKIIKVSRERYGQPRKVVEEKIARWSGIFEESASKSSTFAGPRPSPSGLYDAVCSLCKKKVKVIFLPDGKRPIFCESCLKKAKKGEIEIPKEFLPTRSSQSTKKESYLELEKLGIEFASSQENISSDSSQTFLTQTQQIKKEKFETECWECKQKIKVKFKPDGIRPVYCNNCFTKKKEEKTLEQKNTNYNPKEIFLKQAFQQKPTPIHQPKKTKM
jgi:CxxC-x17-CxxC domain-containing protein